jgi:hypothetical protein
MATIAVPALKPGTLVLYYNRWTGYENRPIKDYFRQATDDEIRGLKPGDVFWMRDEPHMNGKVYGFVKKTFSRIIGDRIYYEHGYFSFTPVNAVFLVDDEAPLVDAIASNPLVTDVIGSAGRLLGKAMGLE